jgi:hypothetical protein
MTDEKRQFIIDNYKELIPDMDKYVNERKNPIFDFKILYQNHKLKKMKSDYNKIIRMIADIRNNEPMISAESNTLFNTDNKYSNECKRYIKNLLAKGWNINEVTAEIEKVYGAGRITKPHELTPNNSYIIFDLIIMGSFFFFAYKIGKLVNYKLFKRKI